MAKSDFANKQELQDYINSLKEIDVQYKELNKQAKELANTPGKARQEVLKQLKLLKEQYDTHKEIILSIKQAEKELASFEKTQERIAKQSEKTAESTNTTADNLKEQNNRLKSISEDWEEIDGLQRSITSEYGKQFKDVGAIQKKIDSTKAIVGGLSALIQKDSSVYGDQLDKILDIVEVYKEFPTKIAALNKEHKQGRISNEKMLNILEKSSDTFDEMISGIQATNDETQKLIDAFRQLSAEQREFNKVSSKQGQFEAIDAAAAAGGFLFGGVSGGGQIVSHGAEITKNMVAGADLKMISLVGALIGAVELFAQLQGSQLATAKAQNAISDKFLESKLAIHEANLELSNFLYRDKALIDFKYEVAGLVNEFQAVSKTAFFGSSIGSIKYATELLALAGISTSDIVSSMSELSRTANSAMQGLGENVAVFSKKTGIGAGEIGNILKTIRIFDKTGGSQAFSTMETSLSKAAMDGYNLADISSQIANSAELAAEFNISSYKALLKQITATRQLGGDFDKIANAGKSMVLNYKDSIKAEMTLGAILGENVDLSTVRALFAAGRPEEAYALLKSSGLAAKAQSAGLFAVEALKQATGGLDITQMIAPKYEKGPKQGIVSNQQFLETFKSALQNQRINTAYLDIQKAQDMAIFDYKQTSIKRADVGSINIAADIIRQDAQNFLRETIAKLKGAGNAPFTLGGNALREEFPMLKYFIPENWSPNKDQLIEFLEKKLDAYDSNINRDYIKNPIKKGLLIDQPQLFGNTGGFGGGFPVYTKQSAQSTNTPIVQTVSDPSDSAVATLVKILDKNDKTMKHVESISKNSNLEVTLLKNIEVLQAMMVKLTNPEFKLILDGKDITSAITQRVVNSTAVTKDPTLRVRGLQ